MSGMQHESLVIRHYMRRWSRSAQRSRGTLCLLPACTRACEAVASISECPSREFFGFALRSCFSCLTTGF
ncbi:hypothetical protein NECAME_05097 [Necator americanus]|uniref:Uncharacterized protein n=1 Tax=Necator americanus TaxID=51031 RepID=W2SM21_NECAM|nr:hypothetical protein NECAME_05097 [Necator americanus]ETN69911.1 hypothetical protein NECAME_05097 [Necator americanus]